MECTGIFDIFVRQKPARALGRFVTRRALERTYRIATIPDTSECRRQIIPSIIFSTLLYHTRREGSETLFTL